MTNMRSLNRLSTAMTIGPWHKSNITIWTSTDRLVGRVCSSQPNRCLAVVIMEPLRGGRLAQNPAPKSVEAVWAKSEYDWTPAAWALQWLWDQPEVSVVLSGMSTMEQVKENIETASTSSIGKLRVKDLALIDEVREAYDSLAPIPCTKCEYCLPCPNGVAIPRIFEIYNEGVMYDEFAGARWAYHNQVRPEARADNCIECGECEAACPQSIQIIDWLAKAHEKLTEAV